MTMAAAPGYSLHQCAVDAEAAVEKLATELAHAGVDPQAVAGVTKMADNIRQIVKVVGQGQESQPSAPSSLQDSRGDTYQPGASHDSAGDMIQPGAHVDSRGDSLTAATARLHAQILAQHGH